MASKGGASTELVSKPVIPQRVYSTGMFLGVGAIFMFFMALLSAWAVRKGFSSPSLEAPIDLPWRLLIIDTIVLLGSSGCLEAARRSQRDSDPVAFRKWWYAATLLGLAFLIGQFAAWRILVGQGIYLASNPNASFFYLFTGAHAIHLFGGILGLLVVARRPLRQLTLATATRVARMYWHFLTILWVSIFWLLAFGYK